MLRRLKGTEGGNLVVVWVRKAFSEQERKEEEEGMWEEMRSFVLCLEYKEVWEYPCGIIKEVYKNGQQGKTGNKM